MRFTKTIQIRTFYRYLKKKISKQGRESDYTSNARIQYLTVLLQKHFSLYQKTGIGFHVWAYVLTRV